MRYLFALLLVFPLPLFAATLDLVLHPESEGSRIVSVRIDTDGEDINAVEGALALPAELSVREIIDGDSFVHFWIERPEVKSGVIRFSGITPGGYRGVGRELFAIVLDAAPGDYAFQLTDARALRNDGEATVLPLVLGKTNSDGSSYDRTDSIPPETFAISRGTDSDVFEGKPFIVFATQDKHSGIANYEVAYSWIPLRSFAAFLPWREVESPHQILRNSYLYIRATDRAGNTRVATLSPEGGLPLPVRVFGFGILLILVLRVLYYVFTRTRR